MNKNINSEIKNLRINRGFKTRGALMRSIEKYLKENNKKKIGDKTIQRMENDLVASENTINVVAAVLNVNPEELKDRGQTPPKKKIPEEAYSTINLKRLETVSSNYFKDNFSESEKRKFILELGSNTKGGQIQAVKQFMSLVDSYAKLSTNIIDQIKSDEFGESSLIGQKLEIESEINFHIENLKSGCGWELNDEMYWIPSYINEGPTNPIYIYFDTHPYTTYWPTPEEFYLSKIAESPSGGFSKIFDGSCEKRDIFNEILYHPSQSQTFVLAPYSWLYSIFLISNESNIEKLTYKNMVSKIVMLEWQRVADSGHYKVLEPKNNIIGKTFKGLFDNILADIVRGVDDLPKNYIEDSDFTKIYKAEKPIFSDEDQLKDWVEYLDGTTAKELEPYLSKDLLDDFKKNIKSKNSVELHKKLLIYKKEKKENEKVGEFFLRKKWNK